MLSLARSSRMQLGSAHIVRRIAPVPPFMGTLWAAIAAWWSGLPNLWIALVAADPVAREIHRWRCRNAWNLTRGMLPILLAKIARWAGLPVIHCFGVVHLRKLCQDGTIVDYGIASLELITTAGVNKIVALLNGTDAVTALSFKYHGFGTGAVAPANGDTALGTEGTTQYNPDNTRPTGSQTVGGAANVYRTVATYTPDQAHSPTEIGLFSAASAGTLLDRFTNAAIPLNGTGDAIQSTIDITFPAGG